MGQTCSITDEPSAPDATTENAPQLDETVVAAFTKQKELFASGVTRDLSWRKQQIAQLMGCVMAGKDRFSKAQEADGVSPSDFAGASGMVAGAAMYYQAMLERWAAPKTLNDTCPPERNNGIDCDWVGVMEPKGVILNIAPWNAPTLLCVLPCLGALAAGNVCIIKPSEATPATSALLREIIAESMSPDVVTVVEGGPSVSEGLIDLGFDHIMFTGGPVVGKLVMARAARTLTPVTLELGGKNPCMIDEMSDGMLTAAVAEIVGTKKAFAGQFCQCHDVLLVVESMWDKFTKRLEAFIENIPGGRMVRTIHQSQFSRVKKMLDNHSGKLVPPLSDKDAPNAEELKFPVCAILEPSPEDLVMKEEVFGPLWCVIKVPSISEGIAFANSLPTGKPLVSYYYGESDEHADQWVAQTSSGSLAINCGPYRMQSNFEAAIHGVGNSGMGGASLWGEHVFKTFSHQKFVVRTKPDGDAGLPFAGSIWSGPPGIHKPSNNSKM